MKSTRAKILLILLIFLAVGGGGIAYLFLGDIVVLNPQGIIAEKQRDLIVISTVLMLIIVAPVLLLIFAISWWYRAENKKATYSPRWWHSTTAEIIWWGVPCIITVILGVLTLKGSHELNPFKPLANETKPIRIQAVALQWKWLFIYPELNIATINYIQFPEKTPLNFEISADAPMNSFWIPALGGQIYAMAGMRSKLHLMANDIGVYRGSSANISGTGFSGMTFVAKSSSQEDFEQWVHTVKQASSRLTMDEYKQLVKPSQYDPAAFYVLGHEGLFDWIVMKYMGPEHARQD